MEGGRALRNARRISKIFHLVNCGLRMAIIIIPLHQHLLERSGYNLHDKTMSDDSNCSFIKLPVPAVGFWLHLQIISLLYLSCWEILKIFLDTTNIILMESLSYNYFRPPDLRLMLAPWMFRPVGNYFVYSVSSIKYKIILEFSNILIRCCI